MLHCPCLSVWVQCTCILWSLCTWAARWHLPAVSEYKGINHNFFISGSEIILDISIKISTQTADFALRKEQVCLYLSISLSIYICVCVYVCVCSQTLNVDLSFIMRVVFLSQMTIRPFFASMTRYKPKVWTW